MRRFTTISSEVRTSSKRQHHQLQEKLINLHSLLQREAADGFTLSEMDGKNRLKLKISDSLVCEIRISEGNDESSFWSRLQGRIESPPFLAYHDISNSIRLGDSMSLENGLKITVVKTGSQSSQKKSSQLRETVLPTSTSLLDHFHEHDDWLSLKGFGGVYHRNLENCPSQVTYRLVPISRPTFVVFLEDFESAYNLITRQGNSIGHELMIGGINPMAGDKLCQREQQLSLSEFHDFGFGLRLSNHPFITKYFINESETVLENTLDSLQSTRVFGGPAQLLENKYGYSGDCWSEVKAMGASLFSSSPVRIFHSKSSKGKISKPPSIVE